MIETTATFALLGAVLGAAQSIPYLRDTWRRWTVPHRGSWLIWSVIEVIALESQRADGARWSLLPLLTQAVGTCAVFLLSISLGSGGVRRHELGLMALAGTGVAGWIVADEPVIATTSVVIADFIAVLMMLPKAWRRPHSETTSTYALASFGGLAAMGAVSAPSLQLLMYPVYFALVNAALTLVLAGRRRVSRPERLVREDLQLVTQDRGGSGHRAHLALGAGARQVLHPAVGRDRDLVRRREGEGSAYAVRDERGGLDLVGGEVDHAEDDPLLAEILEHPEVEP